MKTIEEIKKDIEEAKQDLKSIELGMEKNGLFSETKNQQDLMDKIENIRNGIYGCFKQYSSKFWEGYISLLEDVLTVSDGLKNTYISPAAYNKSNEIFDTIREIKNEMNNNPVD